MASVKKIKTEELMHLRDFTRKVASILSDDANAYFKSLTPLFSPRKLFGELMAGGAKEKVVGAEKNFSFIEERYKLVMKEAFGLPAKMTSVIPQISSRISLSNWRYIEDFNGSKVTLVAPTEWVVCYEAPKSLQEVLQLSLDNKSPLQEELTSYVLSHLAIQLMFENNPGLRHLIKGLGYELSERTLPEVSGGLVYMVISSPVQSFRPQDELVLMATQFSGNSVFEQLVDHDEIEGLVSPLKLLLTKV